MRSECIVLSVANHKGGVGKTSTAINLACAFAGTRRRVLLIDLDPQGSATVSILRKRPTGLISSGNALMSEASFVPCIKPYNLAKFDLVPANDDLTAFCVSCINEEGKEFRLKNALSSLRLIYDLIIIDCPPALNLLTINALCASDDLIIPTTCDYFAVDGLSSLLRLFEKLKTDGMSNVRLMGIVRTLYSLGEPLAKKISEDLKSNLGTLLFNTIIPYTSLISEAPSMGRPVILYDRSCLGSRAYLSLAGEILKRMEQNRLTQAPAAQETVTNQAPDAYQAPAPAPEQSTAADSDDDYLSDDDLPDYAEPRANSLIGNRPQKAAITAPQDAASAVPTDAPTAAPPADVAAATEAVANNNLPQ
ncbi:ParA family protein [Anaerobiospirillum succiniciproducens]|uniref:ParA family protein n=1 Tax=Anaerobiospirillum succiniciproducens TaxID=13335 RepID=UPI002355CE40|nr:ParA family protein [Anaerobiospirillum succiniciproducens]MCI6863199.1 ParA family protein [Anaerobiospirillum succiniciproducens]